MTDRAHSNTRIFFMYTTISTICLFLAMLSGAFIYLSERMRLLPSYIFFFSFAAFSVMLFQSILTRTPDGLQSLDLREQRGILLAALAVSVLCVVSELTLVPWLKIPAGIILGVAVVLHGLHIWKGFTLKRIWRDVALRFFITDMFFLLVAAVGLFALGWKETWPKFPLIPDFLRPSTVFLGASFPLTLTFTGYLYMFAPSSKKLSPAEDRIFDLWYYVLVGGVLSFLFVILLNLRVVMQVMALTLAIGVFIINLLFIPRLARRRNSLGLLFGSIGLAGLLAASTAGNCLIASNTPTIPAGRNPLLLSHVHLAQLVWVCISFWGILYTIWPMLLKLERGAVDRLPLGDNYPVPARWLAYLQLVLAVGGISLMIAGHLKSGRLLFPGGLALSIAALVPIPILLLYRSGLKGKKVIKKKKRTRFS